MDPWIMCSEGQKYERNRLSFEVESGGEEGELMNDRRYEM
jgi:hypothetical protein